MLIPPKILPTLLLLVVLMVVDVYENEVMKKRQLDKS